MRRPTEYLKEWNCEPHPDTARILAEMDRTLQVWEIEDDVTHFVVGPPKVTAYTETGRPFQFTHNCYTIDEDGDPIEWPLIETIDRPLETRDYTRLA